MAWTRQASSLLALGLCVALWAPGSRAAELSFQHSLDGGKTFVVAGTVEGVYTDGDATIVRPALTGSALAQFQALAEKDQLYTVRFGPHATTSVRASCFAAESVYETITVSLFKGLVTGISYVVSSPTCSAPTAPGASVQLPQKSLPLHVVLPVPGPQLMSERVVGGPGSQAKGGAGLGDLSSGGIRQAGGATNRPVGGIPGGAAPAGAGAAGTAAAAGGEGQPAQPPPEQTWLQKNWMFVAGGVLVAFNVLSSTARQANGPAPGGPAPGAVAARR